MLRLTLQDKRLALWLLILGQLLFILFSSGSAWAEDPVVRFNETRYEFGSVKKGVKIIHDFEFRNDGGGILRIEKLIPA